MADGVPGQERGVGPSEQVLATGLMDLHLGCFLMTLRLR